MSDRVRHRGAGAAGRLLLAFVAAAIGRQSAAESLYLIRPDGSDLVRIADYGNCPCGSPAWAPDGRRIAFDTWGDGEGTQDARIAVASLDGRRRIESIADLGYGAMPSWSPDGTQIVCHTYAKHNRTALDRPVDSPQIVVINADGSGREAVLDQWGSPRWRADGRCLVSLYRGGLAEFDLATGEQRVILSHGDVTFGFSISPDGERYGVPFNGGGFAIASHDVAGGGLRLTYRIPTTMNARHSSWSPVGDRLVVMIGTKRGRRLHLLDAGGDTPPTPLAGIPADWKCADPSWSPDGEWIVFSTAGDRS